MNSKQIIQSINSIYDQYNIPKNLRRHMATTAGIGELILKHWKGPKVDKDLIIAAMLTHDLGNIVKYKLRKSNPIPVEESMEELKKMQKEAIEKYGSDDHEVTQKILKEIRAEPKVGRMVREMHYSNNLKTMKAKGFEAKICAYCDMRAGPFGVVSLDERMKDAKVRYPQYFAGKKNQWLIEAAFKIEKQILEQASLKPADVNNLSVKKFIIKI